MIQIKDKFFAPFISETAIQQKIRRIAAEINKDYFNKYPLFLVVLNGSFIFAADLLRQLDIQSEICFVKLSSYVGTNSTGVVQTHVGLTEEINNRDVIIIEDIIDSGKTLHTFRNSLKTKQPSSIRIATLLYKPHALKYPIEADYIGFEIENDFVVGYGLDYDELGRNLNCIYKLTKKKNSQLIWLFFLFLTKAQKNDCLLQMSHRRVFSKMLSNLFFLQQ